MKIYLAAIEPFNLKFDTHVLLSFYDIYISTIPFRKETWKEIKDENISCGIGSGKRINP